MSLFFEDLLDAKVREFNPRYAEAEANALGVDQIRRCHCETPELFVPQRFFTASIGFSYGVT